MSESNKDKIIKYQLSTANKLNNSENGFKSSYTTNKNTLTDAQMHLGKNALMRCTFRAVIITLIITFSLGLVFYVCDFLARYSSEGNLQF